MSTTQFEVRAGRPSGYTQLGDWVLLAPISDRAVRIYGLLRMHCEGPQDVEAWPSQRTLADMLCVKKVDTIQNAIKELVDLNAVEVDTVPTARGRHNRYTVHLSPPPRYDRGPRDRASFYEVRQLGGTPKSGVTRLGDHPCFGGDGSPPYRGSEGLQVEGLQEERSKPSVEANASTGIAARAAANTGPPQDHDQGAQQASASKPEGSTTDGQERTTSSCGAGVGTHSSADDLGGWGTVTDLFGTPPPPAPKPRTRKTKAQKTADGDHAATEANQVVGAWITAWEAMRPDAKPSGQRTGQVGREAKALLLVGNDLQRVIEAAEAAARSGSAMVEREFTNRAAHAAGNGHVIGGDRGGNGKYRNPADPDAYTDDPFQQAAREQEARKAGGGR
jgi:hypothetical protein